MANTPPFDDSALLLIMGRCGCAGWNVCCRCIPKSAVDVPTRLRSSQRLGPLTYHQASVAAALSGRATAFFLTFGSAGGDVVDIVSGTRVDAQQPSSQPADQATPCAKTALSLMLLTQHMSVAHFYEHVYRDVYTHAANPALWSGTGLCWIQPVASWSSTLLQCLQPE